MAENTYNKVKKFIEKHRMITKKDVVAVGVSGGADSVCLLHMLWRMQNEYDIMLAAVHVNHGVRVDAAQDAEYVSQLCERLNVPFLLKNVNMEYYAKERKLSVEEAGRALRYEAFHEALVQYFGEAQSGKIAVAHNGNDRAETMLFHLFRGSGIKGIASIQPVRGQVIRPLLCLERREIEAYLAEQRLDFREDSTNAGDTYTRNKIRHHILPCAEQEICTKAVAHMMELADILSETEHYMEGQTWEAYARCVKESAADKAADRRDVCKAAKSHDDSKAAQNVVPDVAVVVDLAVLQKEPSVLQERVLLLCLEQLAPYRKDITSRHVEAVLRLMKAGGSKEAALPCGICARKEYDRLYLGKMVLTKETADVCRVYDIRPPMEVKAAGSGIVSFDLVNTEAFFLKKEQNIPENRYTKWFDYDKITTSLQFRTRRTGDYITVDEACHRKSLKAYMVNEKIPKTQRDSMYILADGAHVLWIPGYRISQYYKVDKSTKRILRVCIRGGFNGGAN